MTKGRFYLLVSAFIYGITPVIASYAYRGGINGVTLTFLRSSAALPLLWFIIRADKRPMRIGKKTVRQIFVLGVVGGSLPIILLYWSYKYIATGLATTLHFIYPLIIVLASAVIYREKVNSVVLSAVMLVTVGIFMFSDISAVSDKTGIILALLSGVFYSFYVIYIVHSGLDKMDYMVLTFYVMIAVSVSTLIFGLVIGEIDFKFSALSWSMSVLLSLLATLVAMPLFQIGVRLEGAATAGILSTLEPITSIIAGMLFLGESITTGKLIGSSMILFGILLIERQKKEVIR